MYFTVALARNNMPLSNKDRFGISVKGNGIFMAVLGAASVITQSIGLPFITSNIRTTHGQLIAGCIIMIISFFGNTLAPTFELTLVAVSLMIFGSGILSTTITASYSQALPKGLYN